MIPYYLDTLLSSTWIFSCLKVLMVEANLCYDRYEYSSVKYKYCSSGCCGPYDQEYCCLSTGAIIGIVVGIVVTIILAVVVIIKCCNKAQGNRGRVRYGTNVPAHQPIPQITIVQATTYPNGGSVTYASYPETVTLTAQQQTFPTFQATVTTYSDEPEAENTEKIEQKENIEQQESCS